MKWKNMINVFLAKGQDSKGSVCMQTVKSKETHHPIYLPICEAKEDPPKEERIYANGAHEKGIGTHKRDHCRLATPLGNTEKDHYSNCGSSSFPRLVDIKFYAHLA